jgi:hypothetical protein
LTDRDAWCAGTAKICKVCRLHGGNCECEAGFEPIACPGCEGCKDGWPGTDEPKEIPEEPIPEDRLRAAFLSPFEEKQPEVLAPPVFAFDERLCVYCGQLIAKGSGSEQPGGNLAHVACDMDARERSDAQSAPEVPSEPEPRRCTAPITIAGDAGDVEDECGAVLGRDLHCDVCKGQRCYEHCAGVDHFGGRFVSLGVPTPGLEWKIVEVAAGRFRGQLYRRYDRNFKGDGYEIIATVVGTTAASCDEQLAWRIGHLTHATAAEERAPQQTAVPLPVLEFVQNMPAGRLAADKRAELLHEVIEWLRGCEKRWEDEIYCGNWETVDELIAAAKNWHDRQVVELFSRLAGAL